MKVSELIALLRKCEPEATVSVWDPYRDCESLVVTVSKNGDLVHIAKSPFDVEVTEDSNVPN